MEKRKIGPILLSGLMVGPILGSGIIIIPPLAYSIAGNWAFPAWCLIVIFGFFFARIFGKLSIMFPGEAGVSLAVEHAYGNRMKKLTAFYLMGAVLFGPVAVMLTAAEYIPSNINPALIAMPIMWVSSALLLKETAFIGKVAFVLSSFAAISLFTGGINTIVSSPTPEAFALGDFSPNVFGYTMLLLFWTIVGWEVVGSYSGDVRNPEKTIMQAVNFSVCAIAAVSLSVAAAIQIISPQLGSEPGTIGITTIVASLFGRYATLLMALLALSLCVTTYLMFVGGVAKLACSFSEASDLPAFLGKRSKSGAPIAAILFLTIFYTLVLLATYLEYVDTAKLVALADGFFLANALIGLITAIKLFKDKVTQSASLILSILFLAILLHSSIIVLLIIALLPIWIFRKNKPKARILT